MSAIVFPGERDNEWACQRRTVSCGACCGILNLVLDDDPLNALLDERRGEFQEVSKEDREAVHGYRRCREQIEADLPRFDAAVYVCPFFSRLNDGGEVVGCMAHPAQNGGIELRSHSFYGVTICKRYDCPNKQKDAGLRFSDYLIDHFPDWLSYSRLMPDTRFYDVLNRMIDLDTLLRDIRPEQSQALYVLLRCRLLTEDSRRTNSFEVRERIFRSSEEELLYYLAGAIGQLLGAGTETKIESAFLREINDGGNTVTEPAIKSALKILLDPSQYPPTVSHALESASGNSAKADHRSDR